ncbi:hypothetical protein, partial [Steroidobacter sp.]|uniref:hypothetical protein n=1 Tax=Steroidobacter sp. TaxID=1978227 RepID=UPI0025FBBFCA
MDDVRRTLRVRRGERWDGGGRAAAFVAATRRQVFQSFTAVASLQGQAAGASSAPARSSHWQPGARISMSTWTTS